MAKMKYTKLLLKWVRNTYQKQDSGTSGSSYTSNKYQRIDSSTDIQLGSISLDTSTSSNDPPGTKLVKRGATMTLNNAEGQLIPLHSPNSHSFVHTPDSIPLLDLHPLKSDPTTTRTTIDPQAQTRSLGRNHLDETAPFRVIIVGGGPAGLTLAHTLHQAGIEYTLLEQSSTIPTTTPERQTDNNTSVLLWPNSARILDQLGLLRQAQKLSCPVRTRKTYLADGTPCPPSPGEGDAFTRARVDHGRACMLVDRADLLHLLWKALPGREAHLCTGREVVSVEAHASGVRVICADGSFVEGSIVVGCDGSHGVVRRAVCDLRAEGKREARGRRFGLARLGGFGTSGTGKADRTMEARYYGLVGSAPLLDGLEAGVCYETRGDVMGKTFQVFTGEDTAYFLVYIQLRRPTNKITKYPAENADYLARALADHPITDKIKFGDLWRARHSGKMVDFHEGIAEKWYHERIVLAGDAAHSMTPVLGLGVNTGLQGAVELTNGLRRLVHLPSSVGGGGGHGPDTASIKRLFKEYQHRREGHARTAALISSHYARAIAHQSPVSSSCNWAAPGVAGQLGLLDRQAAWAVRQGVTLDFVEERHFKEGRLKWASPRGRTDTASAEERRRGQTVWVYPGIPISVSAD